MNTRLGTGINLGNALDAPSGEGTWWRGKIKPEFFDDFKSAGFQHVRLPVTWEKHMKTTAPYTIDSLFLERVVHVVNWANKRGLVVVINAHHEGWFKADPDGQMPRFEALWKQLTLRFKGVPDNLLVFEVLNESDARHITAAQTNEMNTRILRVIRAASPGRCVIIGAVADIPWRLVNELKVPDDPYIIATYHCYDPWFFVSAHPRNPAESTWGSEAQKTNYPGIIDPIKRWSDIHKIPVYVGEWGTSGKCEPHSRRAYFGFVSAQSRARGISQAIWDDGGDMRIYTRETRKWNTELLNAVFPHRTQTTTTKPKQVRSIAGR